MFYPQLFETPIRVTAIVAVAALLSTFAGCSVFGGDSTPAGPMQTGIAAQDAAWQSDIQRTREGGFAFGPLAEARSAVAQAGSQAKIQQYDRSDLTAAKKALADAENAWQPIANDDPPADAALADVAQHAHRAQRLAQIARYTAQREINLATLGRITRQMGGSSGAGSADLIGQRVIPNRLGDLAFQPGTARLTQPSHAVVRQLATLLKQNPQYGIAIFGFTDNSAPAAATLSAFVQSNPKLSQQNLSRDDKVKAFNLGLSSARARDVAILLVRDGISADRIGARGFGDQHPVASNATPAGRRKNRRIEAVIVPAKDNGSNS